MTPNPRARLPGHGGPPPEQRLRALYDAFNARDFDALLAAMAPDVDWPNAWEGGRVHGREGVRDYWTRQWAEIDSRVEAEAVTPLPDGRFAVDVHQTASSLDGQPIADAHVRHVYELRDGLIVRMDVEEPAADA